ncbi:hypothetical protein LSH36_156g03016 [Paralvinella palmiformis]|uniref:C2 domain-containing protein n=1 Tax=Paralvinella palmiformis TaxID=53620 RepID=A0AAD9JV14_9ANNE|nr:hypothetical protein LSH36_156g03016 [Paralvinella palmiformis]
MCYCLMRSCQMKIHTTLSFVIYSRPQKRRHDNANVTLVSSSFRPIRRLVTKKKTSTKRNNNNPVWNEALVFNVNKDAIKTLHTELAIYHENLLGNSEFLGKVAIGPNSAEEELSHWNDVINSKSALARWHHLVAEDS